MIRGPPVGAIVDLPTQGEVMRVWTRMKASSPSAHVTLRVNGAEHLVDLEPRTSLLDALRERLELTGSKKGCDQGACGACRPHHQ